MLFCKLTKGLKQQVKKEKSLLQRPQIDNHKETAEKKFCKSKSQQCTQTKCLLGDKQTSIPSYPHQCENNDVNTT